MSAAQHPDRTADICRVVDAVDAALISRGLPTYSDLVAEHALRVAEFGAAVRSRGVGLVMAENWRLRIALKVALTDVLNLQGHITRGEQDEAAMLVFAMLPGLKAAAQRAKPVDLPAGVSSLKKARERRDGTR